MQTPGWHEFGTEAREDIAKQEATGHTYRRNHGTLFARDGSWLCGSCESSFDVETGELVSTELTLDDLRRIKDDLSKRSD